MALLHSVFLSCLHPIMVEGNSFVILVLLEVSSVKREFFLPTVAKCLSTGGVGVFSVILYFNVGSLQYKAPWGICCSGAMLNKIDLNNHKKLMWGSLYCYVPTGGLDRVSMKSFKFLVLKGIIEVGEEAYLLPRWTIFKWHFKLFHFCLIISAPQMCDINMH